MTAAWEGVEGMGKESGAPGVRNGLGHDTQAEDEEAKTSLLWPDHTTQKGSWRKKQNKTV